MIIERAKFDGEFRERQKKKQVMGVMSSNRVNVPKGYTKRMGEVSRGGWNRASWARMVDNRFV